MADIIDDLSFVPGVNLDDSTFTAEELAQAEALLAASISGQQPTLHIDPSTSIYDLHVRPAAVTYLLNRRQSLAIQATRTLQGIKENPELASDEVVNAILSNYHITRRSGAKASGSIRINVSRDGRDYGDGGEGGMVAYAWYVWKRGHSGPPTLGWI